MRSIHIAAKKTIVLSRRTRWLPLHHHNNIDDDTNDGVDEFVASKARGFPRRLTGGIQPPSEVPFHARIKHDPWDGRNTFHLHSNFHRNQLRTIFSSFLPSDSRKYDDNDDDGDDSNQKYRDGRSVFSMPSRQTDMDMINQHEESHERRHQFKLRKKEVYELLDSTIGLFPWSQLPPLLHNLCEKDTTIRFAFDLLDRAAKEPDAKTRITHEMVYPVVQQWLYGYVAQQKNIDKPHYSSYAHGNRTSNGSKRGGSFDSNETRQQRMLSPLNVWKRIDNYQQIGVPLESPTYHKIMEGTTHVKSKVFNNPNGPRLAETILDKMMAQSKRKNPLIRPSAYPFTVAMLSWEQAAAYSPVEASREAPQRALALLQKLKSLYASGWGNEFMPDKNAYRRVMNIFAHRGDGDRVEALLEDLYALYLDHYEHGHENSGLLMPTAPFFSLVLYSWSKSRDPDAAERAEAILEHMLEMEESGEIPNLKVQSNFFNIVMVCWSKQRTLESAGKVQSVFDRLLEYSKTDSTKRPVGASYMALITTWSRFDPAKAEEAFWNWKEQHDNGGCEMRIDPGLIRTLVSAWCKSRESIAAERSDRLLQFAVDEPLWNPTTAIFNMIINKYCQEKTMEDLERAEDLLYQMIAYHDKNPGSDTKPDNLSYLPIIRSWAEIGQLEKAEEFLVDFFSKRHGINGSAAAHPSDNHDNTNSYFDATTKAKIDKANDLDTRIFNCVLKGWLSKASKMPEAVVRAEDLLLLMKTYGVKPNFASFQYVLDAWRRNKASFSSPWNREYPRADAVLALLDDEYGRTVDTKKELYLTLRRGWKMLLVN